MICQPMNGVEETDIINTKNKFIQFCKKNNYQIINSLFNTDYKSPIKYLAKSINVMSRCDAVYFAKNWDKYRGCIIEHEVANKYNLSIIYEDNING